MTVEHADARERRDVTTDPPIGGSFARADSVETSGISDLMLAVAHVY